MSDKVTILFLAANPTNSTKLRLDEEIREIHAKIRAAEFRDSFDLVSRWAVRPLDLLQAFNEVKPHVVHFSGHGSCNAELVLEEDDGTARPVAEKALTALFKSVKDNIRLVLLNACHSEAQAKAISQQIDCTLGMNTTIGDEAARAQSSPVRVCHGRAVRRVSVWTWAWHVGAWWKAVWRNWWASCRRICSERVSLRVRQHVPSTDRSVSSTQHIARSIRGSAAPATE